jgi:hypothetical protein
LISVFGCRWVDCICRERRVMLQHIRPQRFTDWKTNIRQQRASNTLLKKYVNRQDSPPMQKVYSRYDRTRSSWHFHSPQTTRSQVYCTRSQQSTSTTFIEGDTRLSLPVVLKVINCSVLYFSRAPANSWSEFFSKIVRMSAIRIALEECYLQELQSSLLEEYL